MAITTKQQRRQRRNEALQLVSDGMPPTDAATQLTVKWGYSKRTSLRDIEIAQSELANPLNSVELEQMAGWMATQYQRLAARAEADKQFSAAVGALNALRSMVIQPKLTGNLKRTSEAVLRTTPTSVENSDQLGTSQQVSRNEAGSGPLKLPKLLAVLPTSSVQSNSSPDGCCNN